MTLCNAKGVTCDNKATQHYQCLSAYCFSFPGRNYTVSVQSQQAAVFSGKTLKTYTLSAQHQTDNI